MRFEVNRQPFAARDAVHRGEHLVGVWGERVSQLRGDAHIGNEGGGLELDGATRNKGGGAS